MDFEELVGKLSPTLKKLAHRLNGHFTFSNAGRRPSTTKQRAICFRAVTSTLRTT
jgi:hypothetical protein